ncbi:MAG: metal ABC transporter ATP-binding protein [Bacteroidales bacterium]|nr:metal ABC transporter ATP-binding protein [Anaerotignum sp.]MCI5679236.1 metal ABC transporter ATP-binding protein [Bacteroidales bacterium]MDY3926188.1 metal ABC transporter ATP-binding protein [Anaerotignum sp.]
MSKGIHNSCGLCSIEMKNITVISGEDTLLENVNLTFHCGELTALIGKNGAGKTTLLRTLLGERNYKGSISFTDHHGTVLPVPRIGYVPQHLDFDKSMPVSVSDFIAAAKGCRAVWFGKDKKMKENIKKMLEEMDCGYLADRRLGALSGGELQRVLLALATDPVPDLLVLDEPVSGVDMAGLDLFYKRVTELRDKQHMAVLLVSHDLGLIRQYADKVVLLDKTVVAEGEADAVFATEAFKEAFGFNSGEVTAWK